MVDEKITSGVNDIILQTTLAEKYPEIQLAEDTLKNDSSIHGDWTPQEEASARRKYVATLFCANWQEWI